jgi:hypothetical protein
MMILYPDDLGSVQPLALVSIRWTMYDFHSKYQDMYDVIKSALGDHHGMWYHAAWPRGLLRSVCEIDQSILRANHNLVRWGQDLDHWPPGDQHELARLLRANWIHSRLDREPIRKPVFAHREYEHFVVDCGDTRLMALDLLGDPNSKISVLITDVVYEQDRYRDWQRIHDQQQLRRCTNFGQDAEIQVRIDPDTGSISWLEIGDHSTAHHLHDVDQRKRMMRKYLLSRQSDFRFDRAWAGSTIDWPAYDRD